MCPFPQSDRHDAPRLIGEAVPGEAALVEDVVVGFEDAVRQPVIAHELPDVFDRVEFGALRRQRHERYVGRNDQRPRAVPPRLVEQQHGMSARCYGSRYLGEVEPHALGVAPWQHQTGAFALGGADRAIDIGRGRALILGCRRPGTAPGPSPRDAVLLANPRFVLPPQLYGRAPWERCFDRCRLGGEVFLNAGMASTSWA